MLNDRKVLKIYFLGGLTKNQYIGGDCLKEELGQFPDLRGEGLNKRGGAVFV